MYITIRYKKFHLFNVNPTYLLIEIRLSESLAKDKTIFYLLNLYQLFSQREIVGVFISPSTTTTREVNTSCIYIFWQTTDKTAKSRECA